MRLIIRKNAHEASSYIAEYIVDRINKHSYTHDRPFVLGLPTGSSPLPIYASLISAHKQGRISFRNVITFNMDEYVGLPQRDHPASYRRFMYENLFNHIDIPESNINLLDGYLSPDEDEKEDKLSVECTRYECKIRASGGIDLFLGGVGSDGHIAFNEPGSSLASRTRVKALTEETRAANARFFSAGEGEVPHLALTVGVQTIMDSREVVIIATGAGKALAVRDAVEGGVSHMCTLSCLQTHAKSLIVADQGAVGEMKYKNVQYFRDVEETMQINKNKRKRDPSAMSQQPKRSRHVEISSGDVQMEGQEPSMTTAAIVEEPSEIEQQEPNTSSDETFRRVHDSKDDDDEEPDLFPDNMASRIKGLAGMPMRSATFPSVFLRASG